MPQIAEVKMCSNCGVKPRKAGGGYCNACNREYMAKRRHGSAYPVDYKAGVHREQYIKLHRETWAVLRLASPDIAPKSPTERGKYD